MPVTIKRKRTTSGLVGSFAFALAILFNFIAWQTAYLELYRHDDGIVVGKISRVNCFVYKTEENLENVTGAAIRSSISSTGTPKELMTKAVLTTSKGDMNIFLFGESNTDKEKKDTIVSQVSSFLADSSKPDFKKRFDMYSYLFGAFTLVLLLFSIINFLSVFGVTKIKIGKISIT